MKSPHFFKAYCQLGLLRAPNGQTSPNFGVENGPDMLTADFLSTLPTYEVTSFHFSLPEKIDEMEYERIVEKEGVLFANKIHENMKTGEIQVVVGGDHSVTYGSLLGLSKRYDLKDIAYIQIDSHGDMNSFDSSPTGNFHGIYLRPFVGEFDSSLVASPLTSQLDPVFMTFIGNLNLDPDEQRLFYKKGIQAISVESVRSNQSDLVENLDHSIKKKKHLHLSIDIDAFDKSIAPATGIPAENGLLWEDIEPFLTVFSRQRSISIDLVEINPKKEGAEKTIQLGQKILKTLLR